MSLPAPRLACCLIAFAAGAGGPLWAGERTIPLPETDGAELIQSEAIDAVSGIEGKESIVRYYRKMDGTIFVATSIGNANGAERIWSYTIDTDGKPPFKHVLVDVSGSGRFEQFEFGAVIDISEWLTRYRNSK